MSCAVGPGAKAPALAGREPTAGDVLDFGQRGPEVGQVFLNECRQQLHENEVGDVFHLTFGRSWQRPERLGLRLTAQSGTARRHRDDAAP